MSNGVQNLLGNRSIGSDKRFHRLLKSGVLFSKENRKNGRDSRGSDIDYEHMSAEKRLQELGIVLPEGSAPGGNYLSAKAVGNLLYLAGVISTGAEGVITGTAGADRSIAEGYAAARACALTQLAVLKRALGSLDKVREIVSVNGYVNAVAGFPDSPAVINGASDLLVAVFGDSGRHVRAAIGVSALPRNALVELQIIVAV
jgi:enamine deaminase RidA (YjgF/YER057c/UK114 family)